MRGWCSSPSVKFLFSLLLWSSIRGVLRLGRGVTAYRGVGSLDRPGSCKRTKLPYQSVHGHSSRPARCAVRLWISCTGIEVDHLKHSWLPSSRGSVYLNGSLRAHLPCSRCLCRPPRLCSACSNGETPVHKGSSGRLTTAKGGCRARPRSYCRVQRQAPSRACFQWDGHQ